MFLRKLLITTGIVIFLGTGATLGALTYGYYYFTRDLPKLTSIEDYRPAAVTTVYANDGTPVAEFFEERRYPVRIKDVPLFVRNAFLAAEDASFYSHKGIDPMSIARAVLKNLRKGSTTQGGSTITQQVVKNLLLTPEKKIRRKIKEAILSYQLENRFSKDEILEIYLNQIFFGNTAYGVRAAAKIYFHKELNELTLAEAALLAALPKAPTRYSPLLNLPRAKRRQRYVLDQMVKVGFVTQEAAAEAEREKVRFYPASFNNFIRAPYYVGEVRRVLGERWRELQIDRDGLQIYTALDLSADAAAMDGLRRGLREVDKRRGWRGPIAKIEKQDHAAFVARFGSQLDDSIVENTVYPAMVLDVRRAQKIVVVDLGSKTVSVDLKEAVWARRFRDAKDDVRGIDLESAIKPGDVIEVAYRADPKITPEQVTSETILNSIFLDQTPDVEGAVSIVDPHSGKVVAAIGGYSYQRSQFNRVTQSLRQPGSSFKPVVYLAAVDGFKYTPATIVHDTPRTFRVGDEYWTPGNFDAKYLGAITLRTALEKSRNLVSADIVSRIGLTAILQYAKKLGFTSKLGRNLSISLGSSEVTLLELVRAYGVFAAKGFLFDSIFITRIVDRNGVVLYDYENDPIASARRAVSEDSAFIMANMMKGVIERGTGTRVKELGRPVAGKTGTSNDQMDAWFIGFTPTWVCGVWVGFDIKKEIGDKETGGKAAAPIFIYVMRNFLNEIDKRDYEHLTAETKAEAERLGIDYVAPDPLEPLDFSPPDGVDPYWVDKSSGLLSDSDSPNAIFEYFVRGTEPSRRRDSEDSTSYLESPDL